MNKPFELRLTNGELLALLALVNRAAAKQLKLGFELDFLQTAKAKLEADLKTRL